MTTGHTQAVEIVQSYAQPAERGNLMGANRTQALGITTFLVAFTALSGALYSGRILLYLAAVAIFVVSIWVFRKAKPLENLEN